MKFSILVLALFVTACGYQGARKVGPNTYQLAYCDREAQCFEAAKKTCPNGYVVTKYGSIRPEEFSCQ